MAASARAMFSSSRFTELSLIQPIHHQQPHFTHHHLIRPLIPSISASLKRRRPSIINCLISGVDGGGVSDDFVSTSNSGGGGFGSEFSVINNMLKRIEPLDTSVISKGVSDSAKDSMKQTISTMLGLLPSDQYAVTVRFSKRPLDRLIVSSIITGYTLWNAEYRLSLMRNFDLSSDTLRDSSFEGNMDSRLSSESWTGDAGANVSDVVLDRMNLQTLENMSPEALNYIRQLEMELSSVKQELHTQKQESMQKEHINESNNDLLEYLRSLESHMVTELSRPSSFEVEEIIQQLAQNILQIFFKEEDDFKISQDSKFSGSDNYQRSETEFYDTIGTSRDYLAKLLFWCMLLGHHLRGLENRLHLSCVVGLL